MKVKTEEEIKLRSCYSIRSNSQASNYGDPFLTQMSPNEESLRKSCFEFPLMGEMRTRSGISDSPHNQSTLRRTSHDLMGRRYKDKLYQKTWKWKSGRRGVRMMPSFSYFLLLCLFGLLYLTTRVDGSDEDWSAKCPNPCKCIWASGRKSVECKDAGYTTIPERLSDEIQALDLSGNHIKKLTKHIFKDAGLLNLQRIFLKNCGIEEIDREAFQDLKILVELDLSGNNITSIYMETFSSNERLRELYLSDNPLAKLLGDQFPPLNHLKILSLKDCNLTSIERKSFHRLQNLEQLDLSGNEFDNLDKDLLAPLGKLISLNLRNNKWRCDCKLKSFRDWAMSQNRNVLLGGTKCEEPPRVKGHDWNVLLTTDFACPPQIMTLQISGQATDALIVGDVGKDITLECRVQATPPPDVQWFRDGQAVSHQVPSAHGKIYLVRISGDNDRWVNMTIQKSQPSDAGEYTCVGRNPGGSTEKNLTLNFQDVPSGAGVGIGVGGNDGTFRDQSWLWIMLVGIAVLLTISVAVLVFCACSRRRRVKTSRSQDLKTEAKLNGSVAGYTECPTHALAKTDLSIPLNTPQHSHLHHYHHHQQPPQHRQNVITLSSADDPYAHPSSSILLIGGSNGGGSCCQGLGQGVGGGRRATATTSTRLDGYDGLVQTEFELSDLPPPPLQHQPHHMLQQQQQHHTALGGQQQPLVEYNRRPDDSTGGVGDGIKDGTTPLLTKGFPSGSVNHDGGGDASDYPDLLNLPHRSQESPAGSSSSTVPDQTRLIMPQQLNPAALYDQAGNPLAYRHPGIIQHPGMGRPHSPYAGSVASFSSEPPQPVIIPTNRPGYVTLPRRPRVPSWSPASHSHYPSVSTPLPPPSPTGSSYSALGPYVGPKYDNLGPRTTADGSSKLSLNKLGRDGASEPSTPLSSATLPTPGRIRSAGLPYHSPAPHFNFAPIQEHEGPTTPTDHAYGLPVPENEPPLSTLPRSWKPTESPRPSKSASFAGSAIPEDVRSDVSSPTPMSPNSVSGKKVPPPPPPKPKKTNSELNNSVPTIPPGAGDEGTEV